MPKHHHHRLSTRSVAQLIAEGRPGRTADGGNLFLKIAEGGSASWVFKYERSGRERSPGLGPVADVTLAEAREMAREYRKLLAQGFDPLALKQSKRAERAKTMTFKQAAETYIDAHKAGWKSEKHAKQWTSTLATYSYPIIGSLPLAEIDTALILKVVKPIWETKTETATRVRGRIEKILDWARVNGLRSGDNPARWQGHMQMLLPARSTVAPVQHMEALPIDELPGFMGWLREHSGLSALALEFTILTVARSHTVIGAESGEFDLEARTWTIPAAKLKARRGAKVKDHVVPLGPRALEIARQRLAQGEGRLFDLTDTAMLTWLRSHGHGFDVHGFRSTFRDWCSERNNFDQNAVEKALAHTVPDKVEAAYRRGELLLKRQRIMAAWERFALNPQPAAKVLDITARRKTA